MPADLVLVRHGESEGNAVTEAAKAGDDSRYTEDFMTTPGSQWRLTGTGRVQALTIGSWLQSEFPAPEDGSGAGFDRFYVSPYVRPRETAALLGLPGAQWRLNRALRERDWGDIGSIPRTQFQTSPWWAQNARLKRSDPLYWCAPNGESIAMVAEDRVRNVLDTLHRECSGRRVIAVAHGELMWAFRLVLERLSDEQFAALDEDPAEKISNCQAIHYTRRDPGNPGGPLASKLAWMRRATPVQQPDGSWSVQVQDWSPVRFATLSNEDLLEQVAQVPSLFG